MLEGRNEALDLKRRVAQPLAAPQNVRDLRKLEIVRRHELSMTGGSDVQMAER